MSELPGFVLMLLAIGLSFLAGLVVGVTLTWWWTEPMLIKDNRP